MDKRPIINCHTHIFTGDHVPPYLAKTFLPWPFYYLLSLRVIVRGFRFYYTKIEGRFHDTHATKRKERNYRIRMFIQRIGIINAVVIILGIILTVSSFFIIVNWLSQVISPTPGTAKPLSAIQDWFKDMGIPIVPEARWLKITVVVALLVFFKSGRNAVWFLLKKVFAILGSLPGPKSRELARRYINIGRYAFHKTQNKTWEQLQSQYPPGTAFIILPMDMEYMEAGGLKERYEYVHQMEELRKIKHGDDKNGDKKEDKDKNLFYPFVFVEPRRIADEKLDEKKRKKKIIGGKVQLTYTYKDGQVTLGDCFIKDYIETYEFSGFKIYPALGYYPFDKELLPLWKYAADRGIPILTHCIRGNIFFRGRKDPKWDKHPIFRQAEGDMKFDAHLGLIEVKNIDFINNFTHPMNYLCLLDERLLRQVVEKSGDKDIQNLFGYTDPKTELKYNLRHLKLCFGHYGGDDEWDRFMELDRDLHSRQLITKPEKGIDFLSSPGKPEKVWKYADWYSICSSIMLQYDNVYSDLSYIIHNTDIHPLLKHTLMNEKLRKRVLFGTDFFVVRNHKSEKGLHASAVSHISEADFDQIAKVNPREFLENVLHGPVKI